jgi:hypothetical protein
MKLSTSLTSINEQLISSSMQLERDRKWLWFLGSLCVLRLLLFALGIVLYIKGIKVPRWVDLIL